LWAEMQATLEEVELSATGGTRVFGPDHDRKLAELRQAQIALAQAWARSEADEAIETTPSSGDGHARTSKVTATGSRDGPSGDAGPGTKADPAGGASTRLGSSGSDHLGAKMDQDPELDIILARKRREANDRYFHRVNQGVLQVVEKLEAVAVAMKAVELESQDTWQEDDSIPSTAKTVED
jgi:septum formation topological specificity factor MinE